MDIKCESRAAGFNPKCDQVVDRVGGREKLSFSLICSADADAGSPPLALVCDAFQDVFELQVVVHAVHLEILQLSVWEFL